MTVARLASPLPTGPSILSISAVGDRMVCIEDEMLMIGNSAVRAAEGVACAALLDGTAWVVDGGHDGIHVLHRYDLAGNHLGSSVLGALGARVRMAVNRAGLRLALVEGDRAVLVREDANTAVVEPLGARGVDRRILLGGRGVATRQDGVISLGTRTFKLPQDLLASALVAGALLRDGTAVLVELEMAQRRTVVVYDLVTGEMRSRIRLGDAQVLAVAERQGVIILGRDSHIALFDLRAQRCIGERILPTSARACAINESATRIVAVDENGTRYQLAGNLCDVPPTDRSVGVSIVPIVASPEDAGAVDRDGEPAHAIATEPAIDDIVFPIDEVVSPPPSPAPLDAIRAPVTRDPVGGGPELPLAALAPRTGVRFDGRIDAYLADLRGWLIATCRTALAVSADAGRATSTGDIDALLGEQCGRAGEALEAARARETDATQRFGRWNRDGAPHVELSEDLGLSTLATSILLVAAGPHIWGELARAYGACSGDANRPLVDELLISHLLEAGTAVRADIAFELDDASPLISSGALSLRGTRPFASIAVHPAIVRRLQGAVPALDHAAVPEPRPLARYFGPHAAIAALVERLARPCGSGARVVLRGRTSAGRRTLAASLAARGGRSITIVPIEPGPDVDTRLRGRLHDIALRGDLPCISLDGVPDDPAVFARIRGVLDEHRGPMFLRASQSGELPVAPGYHELELPPLDESERCAAWRAMLADAGLDTAPAPSLARRFCVGPGAIARVCASISATTSRSALEPALATALRQHRSTRIGAIANRVEKLASLENLIVSDEVGSALRELCARVRHRRTVLEEWGLRDVATSAYGITALFQGGPGTGKTMAAQAIARDLGYELWRVDLSKIVSKWIGETEKNLSAVFDAAEDGEIILLFDEADSLFGKRTEVKSSNDRNANLETNYLLQRLDTFTGVAILTTNFGTAIDPAFRRRVAVQAQFPFPDDRDRERLWLAHLPPSLPIRGPLDIAELARRFPLTGGYIRNAVLRAAYLAAARGAAVTATDLEQAVRAEYAAHGKLSTGSAIA